MKTENVRPKHNLNAFLDYFIPKELQSQPDMHRRARMFMLSHVFGPFLGNSIPLYLHFVSHIALDYRFWTFTISIVAFWVYPFILRSTKRYQVLAFLSVENLIFCILWACYAYGGIYSPFLPWVLIIPLLSFLYLPTTGLIRNVLFIQIFGSVGIFSLLVVTGAPFPSIDLKEFQLLGLVSITSASIYVAMMALYFANVYYANVLREQNAFERELGSLDVLADNLRNLTQAAEQATAAKADFVASMSHELRTPLNAVIGYSQLLLEDAEDEGDEETARDLEHIYGAGTHLLRLVDDILDFSKIEAGKMTTHVSTGQLGESMDGVAAEIRDSLTLRNHSLICETSDGATPLNLDWHALKKATSHLIEGIATSGNGGVIRIHSTLLSGKYLRLNILDPNVRTAKVDSEKLFDIFSDESDTSATKYGGAGISMALSLKFVQMMGGDISANVDRNGRREFTILIPITLETKNKPQMAA